MCPRLVLPDRRPFAPSALPDFIALTDASDFRPRPSSSLLTLVRRCASSLYARWSDLPGCRVLSLCEARCGLRLRGVIAYSPYRTRRCCLRGPLSPRPFPTSVFSQPQPLQGQHPLLPLTPRLLSRLRINQPVAVLTARLDSRPVASGYLGRVCTCTNTRPCQAATMGDPVFRVVWRRAIRDGRI